MEEEPLGQRLRRLRKERGLSQRELGGPGVSYAYVSRIEAEARRPSVKAVRILAHKLGVSPEYLETGRPTSAQVDRALRLDDAELALRLQGDPAAAERAFQSVLDEAIGAADTVAAARAELGLGLALEQLARYEEAVEHLARLCSSGSLTVVSRPDLFMALGRAYAARGAYREAVELFERSLADLRRLEQVERFLSALDRLVRPALGDGDERLLCP